MDFGSYDFLDFGFVITICPPVFLCILTKVFSTFPFFQLTEMGSAITNSYCILFWLTLIISVTFTEMVLLCVYSLETISYDVFGFDFHARYMLKFNFALVSGRNLNPLLS